MRFVQILTRGFRGLNAIESIITYFIIVFVVLATLACGVITGSKHHNWMIGVGASLIPLVVGYVACSIFLNPNPRENYHGGGLAGGFVLMFILFAVVAAVSL